VNRECFVVKEQAEQKKQHYSYKIRHFMIYILGCRKNRMDASILVNAYIFFSLPRHSLKTNFFLRARFSQ